MFDDILLVVAQQRQPAALVLLLLHQAQAFHRARAAVHQVTRHHHLVRLPCLDVLCHRAQCGNIGMDV